jgi:cytochrome c-type biogenesis protein CcmH
MKFPVSADLPPTTPVDCEIRSEAATHQSLGLPAIVGVAVFLALCALYLLVRGADKPAARPYAVSAEPAQRHEGADMQAMVELFAARLKQEPGNGPGWKMLAKSYAAMGRFADSAAAYGKAAALLPPDAGLLADYADVSAMAQSGGFQGEPARLIRQALELDGRHPKALTLAGTEAYRRGDFGSAHRYWDKAMQVLPADSELAATVRGAIAELETGRAGRVSPAG